MTSRYYNDVTYAKGVTYPPRTSVGHVSSSSKIKISSNRRWL